MIPILPELTAKPTAPKSAIAPQLLVGVASFPALLEQSGIALPKRLERELPGIEQAPDQPELLPLPSPVERETKPGFTPDAGNGFPDPGSLLPLDLPHDGAANRAVPVPRGNPLIPEVSLSPEQRKAPLDLQVLENRARLEQPLAVNPVHFDDTFASPDPVVQSAPLDAPPSPAVSGVAALELIPANPEVEVLSQLSQMIERGDGQSRAERGSSALARDPQPIVTQSIGVATRSVSTGEQAEQHPAAEAKQHPPMDRMPRVETRLPAYARHTPHTPKTAPETDTPAPSRSLPEEGTLNADRKTGAISTPEASGVRQPVDTSESAIEPEFTRASDSPRAHTSPPVYPRHTPQTLKTAPEIDAPTPSRSLPEEDRLNADRKTGATNVAEASAARQPVDTSEPAIDPEFTRTPEAPRADQATRRPAPSHREQYTSEPTHQALKIVADPQLTPASLVTHAPPTSAEPQPAPAHKTALAPESTRAVPIATAPQVTAVRDVEDSEVKARNAAPQATPTAHSPASTTPPVADAAPANTLNHTHQPAVSHAPAQLETRHDFRVNAQVEAAIEQLVQARETGRAARPEMTVRHSEFGAINVRIEAVGTDLRATLNARDPGFVPAIHAALAERGIAAPTDAASSQPQRGHDQGSGNANSHSGSAGQGQHSDPRYGNSLGSGQASSQPYREQSRSHDDEATAQHQTASPESESGLAGASGLFA